MRVCVRRCVRVCVCVCVRTCEYVRMEGRKNTYGQTRQVFVTVGYARNVFYVSIMTNNECHIWKVLALVDQLCWKIVPVSMARRH